MSEQYRTNIENADLRRIRDLEAEVARLTRERDVTKRREVAQRLVAAWSWITACHNALFEPANSWQRTLDEYLIQLSDAHDQVEAALAAVQAEFEEFREGE